MKIKHITYLVLSTAIVISGCSKYLDKEPDMRAQINTLDKVKRLIASAYPGRNYLAMAETYSDNVEDKAVGALYQPVPSLYFWEDINDDQSDSPTAYWNACYEAVAAANHALKALEENDFGREASAYKGEALVARAYTHFMLVSFFAKVYDADNGANDSPGIPYVTEPETVLVKQYERGTVQSVYDNIRKDLEEGLALLDAGNGVWTVPKYHFTPSAAHAFAARFYMFTKEWQKVVDNANLVFAGGDFTGKIIPYNSTFKSLGFEAARNEFPKAEQPYNLLINETYSGYQRWWDNRYAMGVRVFQDIYNGKTPTGTQLYNFGVSYGSPHYTTYLWKEFWYVTNATSNTGYPMLMVPVLIADEVLLNRAEAYAELGNTGAALADINLFASNRTNNYNPNVHAVTVQKARDFYAVGDDKEALIQTVLQFKHAGFMSMGLRWFDIIRKGITVKHNVIGNDQRETIIELKPDDPRRVFQIPQEAALSGVQQNPR